MLRLVPGVDAARVRCAGHAQEAALREKLHLQQPWTRWAELFLAAVMMALKRWMSSEGADAAATPLVRLLVDFQFTTKTLPILLDAIVRPRAVSDARSLQRLALPLTAGPC